MAGTYVTPSHRFQIQAMNVTGKPIGLFFETAENVHIVIDNARCMTCNRTTLIHCPISKMLCFLRTYHLEQLEFLHSLPVWTIDVLQCRNKIKYCNTSRRSGRPTYTPSVCKQRLSVHICCEKKLFHVQSQKEFYGRKENSNEPLKRHSWIFKQCARTISLWRY